MDKKNDFEIITQEFADKYKDKTPPWGFNGLGFIVYKRTYARLKLDGEKENWHETIRRCINGAQKIGAQYTKEEAERLFDLIFNLKCSFGGRMLWQLGTTTVDRFGLASLLNCWYTSMREMEDFCFLFEHLMLGGGVGFSVKREDIHELPRIKKGIKIVHENTNDADFIVPDSRQGWVQLLRNILLAFYNGGKSFTYSTILIRGAGELIRGFGGTASGPGILIEGIEKIVKIFQNREGKKLRSIDVLDINNIIGSVVVAGNVRRSAELAIGDPDDYLYLRAKRWDLGNIPNWRSMSNNSLYIDEYTHISDDVWSGYNGNGEPYGFINLPLSQKYGRLGEEKKDNCEGFNPCITKDTWITTSDGPKLVSDLINTPFNPIVNGKSYKSKGFFKTGDKNILKLKLDNGMFLRLTSNHQVLTRNKGVEEWKEACKLSTNDAVVLNNHKNLTWGGFGSFETGWLIGELIGDGNICAETANLDFWGDSSKEMCDTAVSRIKATVGSRSDLKGGIQQTSNVIKYRTSSKNLYNLAQELGLDKNKTISPEIEKTSSDFYAGFLRGYFDSDGSVQGSQTKGVSIRLTSVNLNNLYACQRMLSKLGIISKIFTNRRLQSNRLLPDGKGSKKEYPCQATHELIISKNNILTFSQRVGFTDFNKSNKLSNLILNYKRNLNIENFTSKVISLENDGFEDVYDCTVPEISAFDANGLYIHNCAEIGLADGEACNLCEIFLNNINSKEELVECAKLLYKTQKCIWDLPALYEKTSKIVKKNRRIGLGVTGVCQSLDKLDWLDGCYKELRIFDKEWSNYRGWPESIKLTTVKPSGTLSLLAGSSPGGHPAYDYYYNRTIRMSSGDNLVKICRDLGYKTEYSLNFDGTENHDTVVVYFPCKVEENALVAKNLGAIEQLELVKKLQTVWSDNSVSVTVYYKKEELNDIKDWLKNNYQNSLKTVSFLLHQEHGFKQAPYQPISKEEYEKLIKKIKPIDSLYDIGNGEIESSECSSGACPIK